MKRIIPALAAAAALCPSVALAATDGLLSQVESEGSFDITLTIEDAETIIITGAEDAVFDFTIGDTTLPSKAMDLCIYTSKGTTYEIDIIADPLVDTSGATPEYYEYDVDLFDNVSNQTVATGTITTAQQTIEPTTTLDPASTADCTTTPANAKFTVELATAPTVLTSGATGTIQLLVKPM